MGRHSMEEKSSPAEGQCQSISGSTRPTCFKLTMLETPKGVSGLHKPWHVI